MGNVEHRAKHEEADIFSTTQLLEDFRRLQRTDGDRILGVPQIDRILRAFHHDPHTSQHSVVEITSGTPGSGKTHLLYYLTATAVLPAYNGFTPPGPGGAAVVLDTDNRFSVPRLAQVMLSMLQRHAAQPDPPPAARSAEETVLSALRHIHIFQPQSLPSLVATVARLPSYLLSPGHHSAARSLDLLVLDSAAAFFWQDKHAEEAARFDSDGAADLTDVHAAAAEGHYARLVRGLREVQRRFECPVVATNWGLSPASGQRGGGGYASFKPFLPPVWQGFCTVRLVVERDGVTRFPAGMGLEGAMRDMGLRQRAVEEGGFSGWVDRWGEGEWRDEARETVRDGEGERGRFVFEITGEGVVVGDGEALRSGPSVLPRFSVPSAVSL